MRAYILFTTLLLMSFAGINLSILILILATTISITIFKDRSFGIQLFTLFIFFILAKVFLNLELTKLSIINLHESLNNNFAGQINSLFSEKYSQFLIGITIGGRNANLDYTLKNLFKRFNLLHLISVSGANFILISELTLPIKKYLGHYRVLALNLVISTYYIITIGFDNLPASRAFIFCLYDSIAGFLGRPVRFLDKLLLCLCIISFADPNLLFERSLILSIGFTLLYKCFGLPKIKRIFDNEFLKLAIIFLISAAIFGNEDPDFLANILLTIIYPFLFIGSFLIYFFNLAHINLLVNGLFIILKALLDIAFNYLNILSGVENTYLQAFLFVAILATLLQKIVRNKYHEYKEFN